MPAGDHEAGADPKVSALVYVAALQPDVGEAGGGQLMSKFAAPTMPSRRPATTGKYFFLSALFPATYAQDVPASDAQFLADSQQELAEKAGECVAAEVLLLAGFVGTQIRYPVYPGERIGEFAENDAGLHGACASRMPIGS